jgi:hypothetical protein
MLELWKLYNDKILGLQLIILVTTLRSNGNCSRYNSSTFVETLPTFLTVECSAVPTAPTLTATDNCGTTTVAFTEISAAGTCAGAIL